MSALRLTVVGCSGSFASPDSPASCYLVEARDASGRLWRVLLDLGNGALGPLQSYIAPREVDAVLLTHLHADHCLDICGLYVALRYDPVAPAERLTPIHGPRGTLTRLLDAYGPEHDGSLSKVFSFHEWQDGEPVTIGALQITPLRVEHPVEAYGLRVEALSGDGGPGVVLAYTGDTDECENLLPLAEGADLLLAEAAFQEGRDDDVRGVHLTGLRAARAAHRAGVSRLVLTHLPVWNDPKVTLAEAAAAYGGPIEVAKAGAVYELG